MSDELLVCERFRSLQGETRWSGLPATFVRLSGCNLRCRYCDTRYAYDDGTPVALEALGAELEAAPPGDLLVITGGEPLLQPAVLPLMARLAAAGRAVILETNGSLDIAAVDPRVHRVVDVKVPGSGQEASNRWDNLAGLRDTDEVKFVVGSQQDVEFAFRVIEEHGLEGRCGLLMSPVVETLPPARLAAWILASHRSVRLQLQLHRVIWPDRERGV